CDGLIELTTLGEHLGEPSRRNRGRDRGRPEALGAQIALERDIPLEEGSRIAELASCEVRAAKTGCCDHLDRAVAEGARDCEGLLLVSKGPVVVAGAQTLDPHEGGDPPETVLVAKAPSEHLCLVEVIARARPIAEREERVAQVDADVDRLLGRLASLAQLAESDECLLEVGNGLPIGAMRHSPEPRLAQIDDCLFPQLSMQGVMSQPLDLLGNAHGRQALYGLDDAGMKGT